MDCFKLETAQVRKLYGIPVFLNSGVFTVMMVEGFVLRKMDLEVVRYCERR